MNMGTKVSVYLIYFDRPIRPLSDRCRTPDVMRYASTPMTSAEKIACLFMFKILCRLIWS